MTTRRYASRTDVPVPRSRSDIEATLRRYGADQFISGWDQRSSMIGFRIGGRLVRLSIPMPKRGDYRTLVQFEQAERQRWRALLLVVKAKLEAVEAGISTIEQEFLANLILPSGETIGEWAGPRLEAIYERGELPALLPGTGP